MTEEEAIAMAATEWWKDRSPAEAARFQLNEDRLCMPFGEFHRCVELAIGRPVFTHEFVMPHVLLEEIRK